MDLSGKFAVVTGASSGIGAGIAQSLLLAGACVFGTGRRAAPLQAKAAKLGAGFIPVVADSSDPAAMERLYQRIREKTDKLDVVVANAGFSLAAQLQDVTEEHIDAIVGTNLKGTIYTVQKSLPLLADGASVILVSSTMAFRGFPGISVYSATKAAIRALARSWLVELQERKVRINVISPGPIETEGMHAMGESPEAAQAFMDMVIKTVPLRRLGQPSDIGNAVVFLSSDSAGFINGADIHIDGGASQI